MRGISGPVADMLDYSDNDIAGESLNDFVGHFMSGNEDLTEAMLEIWEECRHSLHQDWAGDRDPQVDADDYTPDVVDERSSAETPTGASASDRHEQHAEQDHHEDPGGGHDPSTARRRWRIALAAAMFATTSKAKKTDLDNAMQMLPEDTDIARTLLKERYKSWYSLACKNQKVDLEDNLDTPIDSMRFQNLRAELLDFLLGCSSFQKALTVVSVEKRRRGSSTEDRHYEDVAERIKVERVLSHLYKYGLLVEHQDLNIDELRSNLLILVAALNNFDVWTSHHISRIFLGMAFPNRICRGPPESVAERTLPREETSLATWFNKLTWIDLFFNHVPVFAQFQAT